MKKSFLLTVAAFSTAALIGCSSSSDDNGGQGGGETTINLTSATASSLGSNDTFVGVKVSVEGTKTVDGKEGAIVPADTTLSLTCGEGNIIDDAKDHVAILKTNLNDQCKLSVKAGETTKEVTLDTQADNYVNLPKVEVKQGKEDVTAGIALTKTEENSKAPIEYTVTGKEAGKLVAEEGNVDAGVGTGDLTADNFAIDADEAIKTTKKIFTAGDAKNKFKLDLSQADATVNGNVTIKYNNEAVIPATVPVEITVEGSVTPPADGSKITIGTVVDHLDTTTFVNVPVTFDGTLTELTCVVKSDSNNTCQSGKFVAADNKKSFYIDLAYLKGKTLTIAGTDSEGDVNGFDFAESNLQGKLKALYEVKVGADKTAIDKASNVYGTTIEIASTKKQGVSVIATLKDANTLVEYKQAGEKENTQKVTHSADSSKLKSVKVKKQDGSADSTAVTIATLSGATPDCTAVDQTQTSCYAELTNASKQDGEYILVEPKTGTAVKVLTVNAK